MKQTSRFRKVTSKVFVLNPEIRFITCLSKNQEIELSVLIVGRFCAQDAPIAEHVLFLTQYQS